MGVCEVLAGLGKKMQASGGKDLHLEAVRIPPPATLSPQRLSATTSSALDREYTDYAEQYCDSRGELGRGYISDRLYVGTGNFDGKVSITVFQFICGDTGSRAIEITPQPSGMKIRVRTASVTIVRTHALACFRSTLAESLRITPLLISDTIQTHERQNDIHFDCRKTRGMEGPITQPPSPTVMSGTIGGTRNKRGEYRHMKQLNRRGGVTNERRGRKESSEPIRRRCQEDRRCPGRRGDTDWAESLCVA